MDGHFPKSAGNNVQLMYSSRNLREMSCNGWTSPVTCWRCPAMDGEAPQPVGDILQRM